MDGHSVDWLNYALSECGTSVAVMGLPASLLIAGVLTGFTHCVGMCGPFVLAQVAARLEGTPSARMSEWHRLRGAALLSYHLGRATTYLALGAAGGLVAGKLTQWAGLRWLSGGLLILAAVLLAALALPRIKAVFSSAAGGEGWWSRRIGGMARPLFAAPTGWRGYLLGVLLGFLPCGMVYAALAAASGSGSALGGAVGMAAFAAGTMPALMAVGLAGHVAGQRWRGAALRLAPVLLLLNAGLLAMLAWRSLA